MKDYKNLIIISLAGLALVFYRISQNERFERFEQRSEVYTLKQENNALKAALIERDSIILSSYEWHNRVRIMLGSDSMTVTKYKDLLKLSARGVQKVNHLDMR